MPELPDLSNPRYLDEIGYFLSYEKHYWREGEYPEARISYSLSLLEEVLRHCKKDEEWLRQASVASIGCGCSGDLIAWPARTKIGIDPLLYAYQKLGMIGKDVEGTNTTIYLSVSAQEVPLLDECIDLAVCRNVLDHVPDPLKVVNEVSRILKAEGGLFVGVDIGGEPTPDEPNPYQNEESVRSLLEKEFEILSFARKDDPYSVNRDYSLRIVARRKPRPVEQWDKERILGAYEAQFDQQLQDAEETTRQKAR